MQQHGPCMLAWLCSSPTCVLDRSLARTNTEAGAPLVGVPQPQALLQMTCWALPHGPPQRSCMSSSRLPERLQFHVLSGSDHMPQAEQAPC